MILSSRNVRTTALCLGAFTIFLMASTARAQSRSTNTYNVLKDHVHQHATLIDRLEQSRDYAIIPEVL